MPSCRSVDASSVRIVIVASRQRSGEFLGGISQEPTRHDQAVDFAGSLEDVEDSCVAEPFFGKKVFRQSERPQQLKAFLADPPRRLAADCLRHGGLDLGGSAMAAVAIF